jgi:hypothetical protein
MLRNREGRITSIVACVSSATSDVGEHKREVYMFIHTE